MIELGHFAAIVAFALSIAAGVTGLMSRRPAAGLFSILGFAAMAFAFLTLVFAFVRSDFSVQLVVNHSHTLKPMIYKIAGTWGNHEGSMAMWCLVCLGFGAAGAIILRTGNEVFEARTLGVQGLMSGGALLYLLTVSSPFLRIEVPPLQGESLNPLLQDPALAFHPPLLYLGYVGYSFVFALAAAGLIEGRIDRAWAKTTRGWAMAAFVPLTVGIMLGSYWAYYELGWGGWWFWDPVENASLMPWLIGAALLHSIVVTEKRGSFAVWSALLAVLAYCFSILGAFLVRSGILTSVHAFAVDPSRGMALLFGLIVFGGAALLLFAIRAPSIRGGPPWTSLSREGALMGNNLVFFVATLTVLLGTLFPLMAEGLGRQMSVGEPYFNLTFTPIMALALVALPVVQAWGWGKANLSSLTKWVGAFAGVLVIFAILGVGAFDIALFAGLGLGLGVWLVGGATWEIWRRAKTWGRLWQMPARVWGMTLAHAGLGVFVIGAVVETSARFEKTLDLAVGQSATLAGWELTLDDVQSIEGPNWYADRASMVLTRGGTSTVLEPEKRYYPASRMPTTETAIHKSGTADIYLALGDRRVIDGDVRWTFRAYFNPLVDLVFIGVLIMALGGLFSMFSLSGARRKVGSKTPATTKPIEAPS
ncbi:MAG: heme lyase CcmF/NrfE family subunit [Pseudomonadota bacterium]